MFKSVLNKIKRNPPRDLSRIKALSYRDINSLVLLLAVVAFLSIIINLLWGMYVIEKNNRLSNHGLIAGATVTSNDIYLYGRRWTCSKIRYNFLLRNGATFTGSALTLGGESNCQLRTHDIVSIVYLPDDPNINTTKQNLDRRPNADVEWIYISIFIAILILASIPLLMQLAIIYSHRKLFRIGIWVDGKVVLVKQDRLGLESRLSRMFPIKVLVNYKTNHGKKIETYVLSYQRWFIGKLKPGAEINICYHPNKPGNAIIIESYLI